MPTRNLLYKRTIPVNNWISIAVPTIGEILEDEDKYYDMVSKFTAMPIDMMVALDDIGVNFADIDEYQLFLMMFGGLRDADTSLVLSGIDLRKFEFGINQKNNQVLLVDTENDIKIDKYVHAQIADALRALHHLKKDTRKPGNEEARKYLIERARKKLKRQQRQAQESHLESLIVAMVNTEQFKYNYEETLGLTIYQFNESVRQIIKKVEWDNRMYGIYAGTVSAKDLSQDDLNWLIHK